MKSRMIFSRWLEGTPAFFNISVSRVFYTRAMSVSRHGHAQWLSDGLPSPPHSMAFPVVDSTYPVDHGSERNGGPCSPTAFRIHGRTRFNSLFSFSLSRESSIRSDASRDNHQYKRGEKGQGKTKRQVIPKSKRFEKKTTRQKTKK